MSFDVSHAGTIITLTHSVFPAPVPIIYMPDDTDPFNAANIAIADGAMGSNGDAIYWSTASLVDFTIAVIPKSPSHTYLATLFNLGAIKKKGTLTNGTLVKDITLSRVMTDGTTLILSDVCMVGGTPAMNQASSGRIATPTYAFKGSPFAEIVVPQL